MDIASALKYEVFRPFATTIVPGSVAIGPYVYMAIDQNHLIKEFASKNQSTFIAVVLVAVIAASLVMEDLGSRVELRCRKVLLSDRKNKYKGEYKKLDEEWKRYLKLEIKDEIIGQRYLRTIHLRMKFELSMIFGLPTALCGIAILQGLSSIWRPLGFISLVILLVVLTVYMIYEAFGSVKILADIRKDIIEATPSQKKGEKEPGASTWISALLKKIFLT